MAMCVSGHFRCFVFCLLATLFGATSAAADPPVNLLRLPQAKLESSSLAGERAAGLPALTDGKPDTAADLDAGGLDTIDLVFGFGDVVAPQTVVVSMSKRDGAVPPARIEVLASTVSPQAGFQSLRGDPVNATTPVQKFAFNPTGARWVMVRLTVARPGAPVSLAEIELLGRQGPPATAYEFGETPARAIDILSRLQTVSAVKLAVSPDEKLAFDKAKAGRLDAAGFADVALLASGVLDAARRKAYLARIDALAAKARAAVGTGGSPAERGEALLRWLHREALAKGYRATQTDLSVLLDEQTFNCVSSAVIYNILALRLGLDARAIEVPDHAFTIVYQGTTHWDVETTNAQGFNPARDPRQVERFERMTGFRYVPESHRDKRREVTEAGLAAIIYYNKGVELNKAGRHHDALLAYFRAMSLDPEFASAAKNALATLANWSVELARQRQWQQAVDVAAMGMTLAPKDALLANNQIAVWQRWAMSLADAGQPDEAVAVLKRAAQAVPKGGFEVMQAWVYIKPGEDLVKARSWQAALAATELGLAKLDPAPRQELVKWRDGLFLRWANAEIDAGRYEAAATALANGLAARPDDKRLLRTVGYLGQEWAKKADGLSKGLAVFATLDRQFPGVTALNEARLTYIWRQVKALVEAGRADDALAAVEEATAPLKSGNEKRELTVFVIDTRAKALMKAGAWEDAADLYVRGLKLFPDDAHLGNNVAWMAQEWQKAAYAKGGAPEVARVAATLAAKFPGLAALRESGTNQIRRAVNEQVKAGEFSKALETLKSAGAQLPAADVKALHELIYDNWAKQRIKARDWPGAADIYAAGLAAAGPSDLLRTNVVYLAQEWARASFAGGGVDAVIEVARQVRAKFPDVANVGAGPVAIIHNATLDKVKAADFAGAVAMVERAREILPADRQRHLFEFSYDRWARSFMDKKQWDEAIRIYDQGLTRLPDSSLFKQNRAYCEAQQKK
jgi:tetratricopeptide (TPR) repeat protein